MTRIKSNRYDIKFKANLTYPIEEKLTGILLEEHLDNNYRIKIEDESVDIRNISKDLADLIESEGGIVEKVKVLRYRGKKKLFDIPTEIKKNRNDEITVRLVGDSKENLLKTIEFINQNMKEFGIKPKICMWQRLEDFDEDNDDTDEEIEEEKEILSVPHIERPILTVPHIEKEKAKTSNKTEKPWIPPTKEDIEMSERLSKERNVRLLNSRYK